MNINLFIVWLCLKYGKNSRLRFSVGKNTGTGQSQIL